MTLAYLLATLVAAGDRGFGQVVVALLMILGYVVSAVMESRKKKRQREELRQRQQERGEEVPEYVEEREEERRPSIFDILTEDEEKVEEPPRPVPLPPRPAPTNRPMPKQRPVPTQRPAPAHQSEPKPSQPTPQPAWQQAAGTPAFKSTRHTKLADDLSETSIAEVVTDSRAMRTRGLALARLGIAPNTPPRETLLRAVLWSEMLGPPRALRGPHRPPWADRAGQPRPPRSPRSPRA